MTVHPPDPVAIISCSHVLDTFWTIVPVSVHQIASNKHKFRFLFAYLIKEPVHCIIPLWPWLRYIEVEKIREADNGPCSCIRFVWISFRTGTRIKQSKCNHCQTDCKSFICFHEV